MLFTMNLPSVSSLTLAALHYGVHTLHTLHGLREQKQILREGIMAAAMLSDEEKGKITGCLEGLPSGNKLCHGDFHPDNVLLGEQSSIIDWMNAMSGNPAGDAARTFVLLSLGTMPDSTPKLIKVAVNMLRNRIKRIYMREYLRLSGMAHSDIDAWLLPVTAARLTEGIPLAEKENLVKLVRERLCQLS